MQHLLVAYSSLLLSLLVDVTCRIAIAVLLGFVGEFAIVCSSWGGDPERSPKRGPNSKLTAAGCATKDVVAVGVAKLRLPTWFLVSIAVKSPTRRPNVLSWTGGVEVSSGTGDHSIGRAAGMPGNLPIKRAILETVKLRCQRVGVLRPVGKTPGQNLRNIRVDQLMWMRSVW